MQVEEDGLLKERACCRLSSGGAVYRNGVLGTLVTQTSTFNQELFIGNSHEQPGLLYIRFHEMMARIFHLREYAEYYDLDSDDDFDPRHGVELLQNLYN